MTGKDLKLVQNRPNDNKERNLLFNILIRFLLNHTCGSGFPSGRNDHISFTKFQID